MYVRTGGFLESLHSKCGPSTEVKGNAGMCSQGNRESEGAAISLPGISKAVIGKHISVEFSGIQLSTNIEPLELSRRGEINMLKSIKWFQEAERYNFL